MAGAHAATHPSKGMIHGATFVFMRSVPLGDSTAGAGGPASPVYAAIHPSTRKAHSEPLLFRRAVPLGDTLEVSVSWRLIDCIQERGRFMPSPALYVVT